MGLQVRDQLIVKTHFCLDWQQVVKCQGWTVSITLLIIRLKNLFELDSQGVASYQSATGASRGETFLLQIHLYFYCTSFNVLDEQDVEDFTPLHPDVLSAPEMAGWVQAGKKKMGEVYWSHLLTVLSSVLWQTNTNILYLLPSIRTFVFFLTLIVSSAPGGSRSSGAEERTSGHLLHCLFSFLLPSGCHWDAGLFYQRMSPTSNFASMMRSNSWTLVVSWCLFSSFDFLFFQTSTAGLLHISVFLALTLPALLVTSIPNTFLSNLCHAS